MRSWRLGFMDRFNLTMMPGGPQSGRSQVDAGFGALTLKDFGTQEYFNFCRFPFASPPCTLWKVLGTTDRVDAPCGKMPSHSRGAIGQRDVSNSREREPADA